jgi:hypothetical protein
MQQAYEEAGDSQDCFFHVSDVLKKFAPKIRKNEELSPEWPARLLSEKQAPCPHNFWAAVVSPDFVSNFFRSGAFTAVLPLRPFAEKAKNLTGV